MYRVRIGQFYTEWFETLYEAHSFVLWAEGLDIPVAWIEDEYGEKVI